MKDRAAAGGESLNTYLLTLIDREVSQPTVREVLERAALRGRRSESDASVVEVIREARLERDDELLRRAIR